MDILALADDRALYVEVKNWSDVTWNDGSSRRRLVRQLERHTKGIAHLQQEQRWPRKPTQMLMVAEYGFTRMDGEERKKLEKVLAAEGWIIELIPSDSIESFGSLIENLR